jgi:hypothetical protein
VRFIRARPLIWELVMVGSSLNGCATLLPVMILGLCNKFRGHYGCCRGGRCPSVRMLWDFVVVIFLSCRVCGLVFSLTPWGYRVLVILVSCLSWYSAENLGLTSGLKCKCRRGDTVSPVLLRSSIVQLLFWRGDSHLILSLLVTELYLVWSLTCFHQARRGIGPC